MTYEDDKYCVMNLGAGRQDVGFEGNKVADICPSCWLGEVDEFIESGVNPKTKINFEDEQVAIRFLKGRNYAVYKKPESWGKKKAKRKDKEVA